MSLAYSHPTPLQMKLHCERIAREARFRAAALRKDVLAVRDVELARPHVISPFRRIERELEDLAQKAEASLARLKEEWAVFNENEDKVALGPSVRMVAQACADYYGVSLAEILSNRRQAKVVKPRQVAIYLSLQYSRLSMAEMARRLNRDHTTLVHARNKYDKLVAEDPEIAAEIQAIRDMLTERRCRNDPSIG